MKKAFSIILLALSSHSIAQAKPSFESPVRIQADGEPIAIVGGYTFPTMIDLNKDGLNDLIVGEYYNGGEIYYYKNIGTKTKPRYDKV